MNRSIRQTHSQLAIRVPLGPLLIEVFYLNYEAPIPGWGYGNHTHSSYELHFISSGKGVLRVGEKIYPIVPGTLYMTGPGVYHEQKADRRDPMNEYCLNFDLVRGRGGRKTAPFLPKEIEEITQILSSTTFWFGHDASSSIDLFERVFHELENQWIGHYAGIQSLVTLIILNALRCFSGRKRSQSTIPDRMVTDSRRLLVDQYFQELDRPRSRGELAAILGTSVRHLNRVLGDFYGMSFRERLARNRLEVARDLLRNSTLALREVATRLGFANQPAFTRAFRSAFGVSPLQYRKGLIVDPTLGSSGRLNS